MGIKMYIKGQHSSLVRAGQAQGATGVKKEILMHHMASIPVTEGFQGCKMVTDII